MKARGWRLLGPLSLLVGTGLIVLLGLVALAPAADETLGEIPADSWIGAPEDGLDGEDLRGEVVLVEFWTYLCYNCKNVEGWMKETHATYADRGLRVIGVHTPEFEVERKLENVKAYLQENAIVWPVAIDNGFRVWRKYNKTNAWPAFLVYDRDGKLIYRKSGEGAVRGAGQAIEKALAAEPARQVGAGRAAGVRVTTSAIRLAPERAVLEVALEPGPGFLLVKSPPNEVRLEPAAGVTVPGGPALLGEPFTGKNSRDVRYYEGGAALRIPLGLAPELAGRPVELRGSAVFHVCDKRTKVCARQQTTFRQIVEAT